MSVTLDPADWPGFRARAHRMLDTVLDKMEGVRDGAVWSPPGDLLAQISSENIPLSGESAGVIDAALNDLMSYGSGNTHPRFLGWVHGAGTPANLMPEMVASAMNANCGGRNHIGVQVERQLIRWCLKLFRLPESGSGLVTTGTSMATLIALKIARDQATGSTGQNTGLAGYAGDLVGYTSEEAHACIQKAFDILGLGRAALSGIPADADGAMCAGELEAAIRRDRENGKQPFLVCATAGTVNTGAIDNLDMIADIAGDTGLWFHVDAAFGAALQMSDKLSYRLKGIARADSVGFDFHKWMQVNYDAGCVLIRDESKHRAAFSDRPDYLQASDRGLSAGNPWPTEYGPELSRGFRALKVWAHMREIGTEKIGRIVEQNCDLAAYLGEAVCAKEGLELLAPVGLNICCFRYMAAPDDKLDALNAEIVIAMQEEGIAVVSTTRVDGKLAIRANITNHRTLQADIDILVGAVSDLGNRLKS